MKILKKFTIRHTPGCVYIAYIGHTHRARHSHGDTLGGLSNLTYSLGKFGAAWRASRATWAASSVGTVT